MTAAAPGRVAPTRRPWRKPPGPVCSVEACRYPIEARGLCRKHYRWNRLYGDPLNQPPRGGPKMSPSALDRAGITKRQRDYWCATGILKVPTDPETGRRIWSTTEVRVAVLLARLTTAGVALAAAVPIARAVVTRSTEVHALGDGICLTVTESAEDQAVTTW